MLRALYDSIPRSTIDKPFLVLCDFMIRLAENEPDNSRVRKFIIDHEDTFSKLPDIRDTYTNIDLIGVYNDAKEIAKSDSRNHDTFFNAIYLFDNEMFSYRPD